MLGNKTLQQNNDGDIAEEDDDGDSDRYHDNQSIGCYLNGREHHSGNSMGPYHPSMISQFPTETSPQAKCHKLSLL